MLTDPREIRKLLTGGRPPDRIDGTDQQWRIPSPASNLARNVLTMCKIKGLSGEDTMTMLAYHALMAFEKSTDQQLDMLNTMPPRRIFTKDENADR